MAKYTATLSAQNTSVLICRANKPRHANNYFISIFATGTFGTGTVTFEGSVDGGTTKAPLKDNGGAVASLTAAGNVNIELGNSDALQDTLSIYATIATATDPSLAITAYDNT